MRGLYYPRLCLLVVGLASAGLLLYLISWTYRTEANIEYVRDTLGGIVLEYRERHGRLPTTLTRAIETDGHRLSHRGDSFGRGVGYETLGDDCFWFICSGPDGVDDHGGGDDVVLVWERGTWFIGEAGFVQDRWSKHLRALMFPEDTKRTERDRSDVGKIGRDSL